LQRHNRPNFILDFIRAIFEGLAGIEKATGFWSSSFLIVTKVETGG
jgi:hypothetical protein